MGNFLEVSFLVRAFTVFDITRYPFLSYHAQNYFGIVIYLLLAAAICSLLAAVAYLFSLSSVQDSEKRSEYECGFEPFDSATRLPFDVHFYLVGILFLIFDVEIALLFPWVLGLHTAGWFSFYIVLGFIVLLGVGFLYEWKRGALIWPSRQTEAPYTAQGATNEVYTVSSTKLNTLSYLVQAARYNKITLSTSSTAEGLASKKLALFSKISKSLKKLSLARRIERTNRALLSQKLLTFRSYLTAIAYTEARLAKYKRAVYFFIKKALVLSAACRLVNPSVEAALLKKEKAFLSRLAPAARAYSALVTSYKNIYKKFKSSGIAKRTRSLPRLQVDKIKALRRYLLLQAKYFGRRNWRAKKERKLLRTQINPQRSFGFHRGGFKRSFVFLSPLLWSTDVSFVTQLLTNFLPEMALLSAILFVLTFLAVELGTGRSKKDLAAKSFSALSSALAFVLVLYGLQLLFGENTLLFGGYAATSTYVVLIKMLTTFTGRFILVESSKYMTSHPRHLLEYPIILTMAIFFMLLLVGSSHLVSAFLSLVGFSLNLYVLVLFDATSAIAREAGVKYFYLSTISSGLILYGVFLTFVLLGTGNFYEMQHILATEVLSADGSSLLQLAVVFMLSGLFFKLSAFPGHLWAAEVYEGSPDPITAFFMLPVKVAVLGFTIQLLAVALEPAAAYWQPIIALSSVFSLVWGCLAALAEKKTKRFLAYASINQIGLLLLGLSTASLEGYRSTLFYLLLYAVMNVGFLTVFLNARREDGRSLLYLTDFRGFGMRYGAYSWSVAIILLSMAGIPPLAGFFGKYYLLLHAQEQGLTLLVIAGIVTSLISTYYYLRLIKIFWFEGTDKLSPINCDLSSQQSSTLTLSECILWVVSIYAVSVTTYLDFSVCSLIAPDALSAFYPALL